MENVTHHVVTSPDFISHSLTLIETQMVKPTENRKQALRQGSSLEGLDPAQTLTTRHVARACETEMNVGWGFLVSSAPLGLRGGI